MKRCMERLRPERGAGLPAEAPARLRQGYGGQPSLDGREGWREAPQAPPSEREPGAPAARFVRGGVEEGCPARELCREPRGQDTRRTKEI